MHNLVSFIFKLGKHESLPLRPLRKLSGEGESPPSRLPSPLPVPEAFANGGQAKHSDLKSK